MENKAKKSIIKGKWRLNIDIKWLKIAIKVAKNGSLSA